MRRLPLALLFILASLQPACRRADSSDAEAPEQKKTEQPGLFTVPPDTRVPRSFGRIPLTRIGVMQRGKPGTVECNGAPLPPAGWDHLRGSR